MGLFFSRSALEMETKLAALDRAQAIIEFDLDGKILSANDNFLDVMGYRRDEVIGRHHAMFVDPDYAKSDDYRAFWRDLRGGGLKAGEFRRQAKGGRDVWIEASYNPVLGRDGRPVKVIKFATDITRRKLADSDRQSQIAAIRRSQAVIEFDLAGNVLDANEAFFQTVGYTPDDIRGRHHSMFMPAGAADTPEYRAFWQKLGRGEYDAGQYRRVGKGGREIWIQASYNPILDASGKPYRVIKFATDITDQIRLLTELRRLILENFGEIDRELVRSGDEATAAAGSAGSTALNVQTMAAAAEELANSVGEIAASMAQSRNATDDAFGQVRTAGNLTKKLSGAATSMSGILALIQTIAAQINLLALNATIESARAGAAGRGFAVVANEVKSLAAQAARATEQISGEIAGVQTISLDVVGALDQIQHSVETMRGTVVATASAVEEQTAVTRDLSMNMQTTARDAAQISESVGAITRAVGRVSAAVSSTREAARVLAR